VTKNKSINHILCTVCTLSQIIIALIRNRWFCDRKSWCLRHLKIRSHKVVYNDSRVPRPWRNNWSYDLLQLECSRDLQRPSVVALGWGDALQFMKPRQLLFVDSINIGFWIHNRTTILSSSSVSRSWALKLLLGIVIILSRLQSTHWKSFLMLTGEFMRKCQVKSVGVGY